MWIVLLEKNQGLRTVIFDILNTSYVANDTTLKNRGFDWEVLRKLAVSTYPEELVPKIGFWDKIVGAGVDELVAIQV